MLTSLTRRAGTAAAAVLAACLVAGCGGGASADSQFTPQPELSTNNDPNPQLPNPGIPAPAPSGPAGSAGGSANPSASPSAGTTDPNIVATKLNQPTGLVVLPDGTALVGERTTGKIYRVEPDGSQPAKLVQQLAGVNGAGDGGLLDLALSPTYNQDGLLYAYLTTATDNRVVHFALGSAPSTVITGIPRGMTGNSGRIAFDATGSLLVGTGDAGRPALASSPTSLAGKILRTDDIGHPMADNPSPASAIYARGLTSVDGLCVDLTTGTRIAVSGDKIDLVTAGADLATAKPAATLPAASAGGGGCALADGEVIVATSTTQAVAVAQVTKAVGTFANALAKKYGRLRTVVAGSDGALWLTTRNRDGVGKPIATDDRVIRITNLDDSSPVV